MIKNKKQKILNYFSKVRLQSHSTFFSDNQKIDNKKIMEDFKSSPTNFLKIGDLLEKIKYCKKLENYLQECRDVSEKHLYHEELNFSEKKVEMNNYSPLPMHEIEIKKVKEGLNPSSSTNLLNFGEIEIIQNNDKFFFKKFYYSKDPEINLGGQNCYSSQKFKYFNDSETYQKLNLFSNISKLPKIKLLKYFLISFLGIFLFSSNISATAIDSFKIRQSENLFGNETNNILRDNGLEILTSSRKIQLYDTLLGSIEEQRKEYEKELEITRNNIFTLEKNILRLDTDIQEISSNIVQITKDVVITGNNVDKLKSEIEILSEKITKNRELIQKYFVHIYKRSNNYFDSENKMDLFKIGFMQQESMGEVVNEMYYSNIIQNTGKKLLDLDRQLVTETYIAKIQLETEEQKLKDLRVAYTTERQNVEDKKKLKEILLEQTEGRQDLYEKYLSDKMIEQNSFELKKLEETMVLENAKQKVLGKYNCTYYDLDEVNVSELPITPVCKNLLRILFAETKLALGEKSGQNIAGVTKLSWPVLPTKGLSAFYQDSSYKAIIGSAHDAIDIPVNQGTSVTAAADGYVIYIEPPLTPDYSYVALKHEGEIVTVYGHLSEILVEEYEFVEAGQVIARSGGDPGTRGAGYFSTGPHLHLEVWNNQEHDDPLTYLDLTYLRYQTLPERYRFKYTADFKERYNREFNSSSDANFVTSSRFQLSGVNEVERQKDLLNKYATSNFRNWNMWVEEAMVGNIDPSFIMCIGLAESSLGRNLTTGNNIGNVGNDDSGNRISFSTPRSGIAQIVKTLNNNFIGQYSTIDKLSCYGNREACVDKKPGHYIYASSDKNWHNNIVTCLSAVKQTYIPDNFRFRTR